MKYDMRQEILRVEVKAEQNLGGVAAESPVSPEQGLAGRELDAAVAERVMGCKVGHLKRDVKQENPFDDYTPYRNNRTGELMSGTMYSEGMTVVGRNCLPCYSTDIAAAMEVVGKLTRECPYDIEMLYLFDFQGWRVEITLADSDNGSAAKAELLPEAICRAALATVNAPAPTGN